MPYQTPASAHNPSCSPSAGSDTERTKRDDAWEDDTRCGEWELRHELK